MKKILSILFSISTLIVVAQEKAQIVVSYDYSYPNSRDQIKTSKMTLLASNRESKYFNDLSLWVDSLKSTPEGKAKYMEILKESCMTVEPDGSTTWDLSKGPSKNVYTYVFTHPMENTLTLYDKWEDDLGYYQEPLDEISWEIVGDSLSNVLGYDCVMAEADYHGRHWKAWFTTDIPLGFGPWKLQGLPGLILKAEADGNFTFNATGIETTDRLISPMYLKSEYSKVDRKKVLASDEYYKNHEESVWRAKNGADVKIRYYDDNGNEIAAPIYDGRKHSIETDYKN